MRFLWILLLVAACSTTDSTTVKGKVVGIADGDTFTLLRNGSEQIKIRLYGIDCPEKAQPFGTAARQKLSDLIFSKSVRIETKDVDRYGRTVAVVYATEGISVNEEMLRNGLAWHYTAYDKNPAWAELQAQARQNKVGLWALPNPTPPWLWRKEKRASAKRS